MQSCVGSDDQLDSTDNKLNGLVFLYRNWEDDKEFGVRKEPFSHMVNFFFYCAIKFIYIVQYYLVIKYSVLIASRNLQPLCVC